MDEEEKKKFLAEARVGPFGRFIYLDKLGRPISLLEWHDLSQDIDYRRVGYDELPETAICGASYVSTVWLGLDHSLIFKGPPVIFETMRFCQQLESGYHPSLEFPDPEDPSQRIEQVRYSTEEQARIGHRSIVRLIQEQEMT